jgi:hypothetical protein
MDPSTTRARAAPHITQYLATFGIKSGGMSGVPPAAAQVHVHVELCAFAGIVRDLASSVQYISTI